MAVRKMIMTRNISVDLVKVVAMFMVMTLHIPIAGAIDPIILAGVYMSAIAIPLFFMVSGYLVINKGGGGIYSTRKISGILKFVFILSVLYYFIESLLIGNKISIGEIVLAFVNPFIQKGIFSVFWYLGAMILIYLSLPLIKYINLKYGTMGLFVFLLILFVIESFVFALNIIWHFEQEYVIQSLRIWNWLFYFTIGALIRLKFYKGFSIKWIWIVLLAMVYVPYAYIMCKKAVYTWEYLYSSPMCMLYSISVFVFILHMKLSNPKFVNIVRFFSNLFLPVYALHIIVIVNMRRIPDIGLGLVKPEVYLVLCWVITIGISWVIMKVPGLSKIFKI